MSKILVIGAEGFIGKSLCTSLSKNHIVKAIDIANGDIAESTTFEHLEAVDHVFHLAGRTFVPDSWTNFSSFLSTNVIGTNNVLEYCRRSSASLTYVSAYIYGKPDSLPIGESAKPKPNNPYALSKYLAEQLCEFYAAYHNVPVTVLRPFNIYGPNQETRFLIPRIIDQVKRNVPIEVMDLTPKRDYLYIDDFIDAMLKTIKRKEHSYCVLNVGSGNSISVKDLIDTIQEVADTKLEVISKGTPRFEELDDVRADIKCINSLLDWQPVTSLKKGIAFLLNKEI